MPPIVETIQALVASVPPADLWALAGLLLLFLILRLSRRRKKTDAASDAPAPAPSDQPTPSDEPSPDEMPAPQPLPAAPVPEETAPLPAADEQIPVKSSPAPPEPPAEPATPTPAATKGKPSPSSGSTETAAAQTAPISPARGTRTGIAPEKAPSAVTEEPVAKPATEKSSGLFARLKNGLTKTRHFLSADIDALFQGRKKIDDDLLEDLEELLITADIGVQTTMDLIDRISTQATDITDAAELRDVLKSEIQTLLKADEPSTPDTATAPAPRVIMVIGVNGVGKTTTIGKLAAHYAAQDKKVLIAAADTFRAAAVEQAAIWAERSRADLVRHQDGSDPAAVAFDGVEAGMARGCDIVLIDTAGRLHTKINLMEELKKIKRSINKKMPGAPHEILLVLDATTGQNALTQAKNFNDALDVTGIALTKLDGTAKGGIVVSICQSLNVPLRYIGVGEQIQDLQPFDARKFVDALF